jgi:formylmethanofuran dehydrogenase subunit E
MCTISRMVTLEKRRILIPSACMGDAAQVPTHCGCGMDWAQHGAMATTMNNTNATE